MLAVLVSASILPHFALREALTGDAALALAAVATLVARR
jgi:hypothetical protein